MVHAAALDSTNDAAARLAAAGWPEGTVVVAGAQRRGRGRRGRPWHSPPGANLYCSFVLRPTRRLREWPDVSWVIGAAVATVVRAAGAAEVALKYPNDVLAAGRKLAGVLLETRTGGAASPALIAGVGLNVNAAEGDLPPALRATATSLRLQAGRRQDLGELLVALCVAIEQWYGTWCSGGESAARARLAAAGLGLAGVGAGERGALEQRDATATEEEG